MKNTLRWAVIIGGFIGAIYVLILLRSEVLFNRDNALSVAAAVRLQPDNSAYLDRLGHLAAPGLRDPASPFRDRKSIRFQCLDSPGASG